MMISNFNSQQLNKINTMIDTTQTMQLISNYPAEVKPDIEFIANICNQRWNGNIRQMSAELKAVGQKRSHSWFYKLLNGKYIENGVFTAGASTIATVAKALKDIVNGLSVGGLIPHTETEIVKMVRNAIDSTRYVGNICKWLIISGTTGSQKSHSLINYADTHDNCIYIESPATHHLQHLVSRVANTMHCPRTVSKEMFLEENIRESNVIIIDNAQRLYNPTKGLTQPTFSFLQTLQDITRCTIVLVFVDEATGDNSLSRVMFGKDKGYFEQLIGRCGGGNRVLKLPTFVSDNDLLEFAKSAGFKNKLDRKAILPILRTLSRENGKLRIALKALQDSARLAVANKKELSIDDFIAILPTETFSDKQLLYIEKITSENKLLKA